MQGAQPRRPVRGSGASIGNQGIAAKLNQDDLSRNALRRERLPNRRLAAIYAARLAALRLETFIVRCQLDNPRNECRRELLTTRLDATDARVADIAARLRTERQASAA